MITTDFTVLREHLKRWWVRRFPIVLSALGLALGVFAAVAVLDVALVAVLGPWAAWGLLLALAAGGTTYGVWAYAHPGYMRPSSWLASVVDYARQPRHFVGLGPDREPVRLHWTVIVYEVGGRPC